MQGSFEVDKQRWIPDTFSVPITLVFGFSFRMLALKYDWEMPKFVYKAQRMDRHS